MAAEPLSKRVWAIDLDDEDPVPKNELNAEWYDQDGEPFVYETAFKVDKRLLIVYKGQQTRIIVSRVQVDLNAQYLDPDDIYVQYKDAIIAYLTGIPLDETIESVSTGELPDSQYTWIFLTEKDGYVVFNNGLPNAMLNDSVYDVAQLQAVFLDNTSGRGPDWGVPQDIYYRTKGEPAVFYCSVRKGYIVLGKAVPSTGQTVWVEWVKANEIIEEFDGQVACAFYKPLDAQDPPALVVFMIETALDEDDGILRILQFELSEDSFKGWGPPVDDYGTLDYIPLGQITGGDVTGGALQAGFFDSSRTAYLYQYGDDTLYLIAFDQIIEDENVSGAVVPKFSKVFPNLNQSGRYQVVLSNDNQGTTIVSDRPFKKARIGEFPGFTIESVMYDSNADTVDIIRPDDIEYE
ncbi:MAG: hypothetical protein CMP20_04880 [Rickettsiales bacterium]|nr:hypothetical protein [Rickettsiales bacterium]